ncbi:hypothetical protein PILCRDRAFT_787250 [Piloderma croceum F 1598]|uniref:C3H1-type domain-containing protein n=1 Tax=Piloderma croceum (strain F 1598) TaxID=765440 RepID=A0A0C3FQT0_PILCF|nr:hypothetical protein PILCRDRAFT_787250 [Piloderma croceum F 1598]
MTNESISTPNAETLEEGSTATIPESQMAKACLDTIEAYRKSGRQPVDKATATRGLVASLSSAMVELSESELNDSLGVYLVMLEQHDNSVADAHSEGGSRDTETQENANIGSKRAASPDSQTGTGKKQKQDDSDFPWISTLKLLRVFAKDLKFAKLSVINSARAPPFPNSEWSNILMGSMVDLDHVISGSFAITNDNREIEQLGGMELKFGVAKPVKQVKTSRDWFIAWGSYSKAATYVFPHRKDEFDSYGSRTLSLFAATSASSHASIINLDKSIRTRVGECRNLLLTDQAEFEDLRLYWLNPIGAGGLSDASRRIKKTDYRDDEPCLKWNAGECNKKASECRHRHICEICGKNHRKSEHKSKQGNT